MCHNEKRLGHGVILLDKMSNPHRHLIRDLKNKNNKPYKVLGEECPWYGKQYIRRF